MRDRRRRRRLRVLTASSFVRTVAFRPVHGQDTASPAGADHPASLTPPLQLGCRRQILSPAERTNCSRQQSHNARTRQRVDLLFAPSLNRLPSADEYSPPAYVWNSARLPGPWRCHTVLGMERDELASDLDAFYLEHRRCGRLTSSVEDLAEALYVVSMACARCGASFSRWSSSSRQ
jgi:hypothetical protein